MVWRRLSKEQMIQLLRGVKEQGWIRSVRPLNAGGIGNTIDQRLGLPENNLPIADTAQWELKTHREGSSSLLTLLHFEPEPRKQRVVVKHLLPKYGWPDNAGRPQELSFRQTLRATTWTDRGFRIELNRPRERVEVAFDSIYVENHHEQWLQSVAQRAGLGPLDPQPFWEFKQLFLKVSTKMLNSFYVTAEAQRSQGEEYFRIKSVQTLQGFDLDRFMTAFENGVARVDFDARTHHNHGTKMRLEQEGLPQLYRYVDTVI
jgi:hypothetical protein